MRDSMVFYRSFFEASEQMSAREFGEFCNAVFQYAFYGSRENQLEGIGRALFIALLPQIDATAQRHQQAVKGGQSRWSGRNRPAEPAAETPERAQPQPTDPVSAEQPMEKTAEKPAQTSSQPPKIRPATRQYGKFANVQLTRREYEDLEEHIPTLNRVIGGYSKYKMANKLTTLWDYDGLICYYKENSLPPGAFVRETGQVRGEEEPLYKWEEAARPPGGRQ